MYSVNAVLMLLIVLRHVRLCSRTEVTSFFKSFSTLTETLRTMDLSVLQPFLPGQPKHFANFLDKALGVQ